MKFCEICKGMLIPTQDGKLKCNNCGCITTGEITSSESIKEKPERQKGVVKGDENIFATYDHVCKKCGYNKAQIVERQPYITDEDTLIYLKCGKCGFSENLSKKIM